MNNIPTTESVRISKPVLTSIRKRAKENNRTVRAEMELLIKTGLEGAKK